MNNLINKILSNTVNKKVFQFLNIDLNKKSIYFRKWVSGKHGLDDCVELFFEKLGKEIPENCKYHFSIHSIMVHPESGTIFAFHTGRCSMFFRCDFERSGIRNTDKYRKGYTMDCIADITDLGENWAYLDKFVEEEEEQLRWAYEKMIKICP